MIWSRGWNKRAQNNPSERYNFSIYIPSWRSAETLHCVSKTFKVWNLGNGIITNNKANIINMYKQSTNKWYNFSDELQGTGDTKAHENQYTFRENIMLKK